MPPTLGLGLLLLSDGKAAHQSGGQFSDTRSAVTFDMFFKKS
jgi:hypothetical protein